MGQPKIDKIMMPKQAMEDGALGLEGNPRWHRFRKALAVSVISSLLDKGWTLTPPSKED